MITLRLSIFASFVLLITACVSKPVTRVENDWQLRQQQINAIKQWQVKGRIGINAPKQKNSANFRWQHESKQQHFLLYGTFGTSYADLKQTEQNATLILSDKEVYQSHDVEQMLLEVLGHPLPIKHMEYWILGLAYPYEGNDLTFDALGYLQKVQYKQWTISYKNYRPYPSFESLYMPGKITITDGIVTLKLSVREWSKETDL